MLLNEWKDKTYEELRSIAKKCVLEDNKELALLYVSEEDISEIYDEIEIESFSEEFWNFDVLDLTETVIDEETGIQQEYVFEEDEFGVELDVVLEFNTEIISENPLILSKVKDLLFAESFEYVIDEKTGMADVTFSRAKGKISKKMKCKPGYKLKGRKCVPQTGTDKAANRRTGIKIKRAKKAQGSGVKKKAALKAKITKKRVQGRARNHSGL